MSGRRIKNKIACLLLVALILGQAFYTSAFPFDNPIIDSIENLFGAIRYDVTIAELVISLLTGAGATPVNSAMAQALETELGSAAYQVGAMYEEGLFSITDGIFHDNGFINAIEDTAAWAKYGLEDIFATTADDIALNGESAIVATGAANLGAVVASAVSTGAVIAATAGVASLAIGGGIAVGVLIDHIARNWGGYISKGIPLEDYNAEINQKIESGASFGSASRFRGDGSVWYHYQFTMENGITTGVSASNRYTVSGCTNNNNTGTFTRYTTEHKTDGSIIQSKDNFSVGKGGISSSTIGSPSTGTAEYDFTSTAERDSFLNTWRGNGGIQEVDFKISPDVIGKQGNINAYKDSNGDTVYPGMSTPIEDGEGIKPINWSDYEDFVNEANNNFANDPENQTVQQQAWDDFVDPYIEETTNNPEIPDNPDENYVPDFSDEITPDTVIDDEVLDDVIEDVIPEQPDIPDKPDLTPGEIEYNLDVSVSGDITDIFPFCIPFDLIALFEKFGDIDREAPHFHFVLDFGEWLGEERVYEIDIDLSEWDDIATLCRTLEIVLFILGLILITRELIRG